MGESDTLLHPKQYFQVVLEDIPHALPCTCLPCTYVCKNMCEYMDTDWTCFMGMALYYDLQVASTPSTPALSVPELLFKELPAVHLIL